MIVLALFTFCICSEVFKSLPLNSSWTSEQMYVFLIYNVRPSGFFSLCSISSPRSLHLSTPIPALWFIPSLCDVDSVVILVDSKDLEVLPVYSPYFWHFCIDISEVWHVALLFSLLSLLRPSENFLTEKSSYFRYSARGTSKEPSFMKLLSALCQNSGLLRMCPVDYSKVEVCNITSFEITSYKSRVNFCQFFLMLS